MIVENQRLSPRDYCWNVIRTRCKYQRLNRNQVRLINEVIDKYGVHGFNAAALKFERPTSIFYFMREVACDEFKSILDS
jgi:hypothetical protein